MLSCCTALGFQEKDRCAHNETMPNIKVDMLTCSIICSCLLYGCSCNQ